MNNVAIVDIDEKFALEQKEANVLKLRDKSRVNIGKKAVVNVKVDAVEEKPAVEEIPVQKGFEVVDFEMASTANEEGKVKKIKLPEQTFNAVSSKGKVTMLVVTPEAIEEPVVEEQVEKQPEFNFSYNALDNSINEEKKEEQAVPSFEDVVVDNPVEEEKEVEVEPVIVEEPVAEITPTAYELNKEVPRIVGDTDEIKLRVKETKDNIGKTIMTLKEQTLSAKSEAERQRQEKEEALRKAEEAQAEKEKLQLKLEETTTLLTKEIEKARQEAETKARERALEILNEFGDLAKDVTVEESQGYKRAA